MEAAGGGTASFAATFYLDTENIRGIRGLFIFVKVGARSPRTPPIQPCHHPYSHTSIQPYLHAPAPMSPCSYASIYPL